MTSAEGPLDEGQDAGGGEGQGVDDAVLAAAGGIVEAEAADVDEGWWMTTWEAKWED